MIHLGFFVYTVTLVNCVDCSILQKYLMDVTVGSLKKDLSLFPGKAYDGLKM